jgi:hypothetical protein
MFPTEATLGQILEGMSNELFRIQLDAAGTQVWPALHEFGKRMHRLIMHVKFGDPMEAE